ncbi:hypothetical protein [Fodinicola feengrottensis]|uniref:hypothetical protein n=1 Tax=Fodinicola feengrottensis TaxID=435914 RepID=UPI0013D89BC1|nr:hypothetical protein [Fodinicola feengrottensis]
MDGRKIDDYGPEDSPQVAFPCDNVGHKYTIVAISDDGTRSKSRSVSVRPKKADTTGGATTDGGQTTGDVGNDGKRRHRRYRLGELMAAELLAAVPAAARSFWPQCLRRARPVHVAGAPKRRAPHRREPGRPSAAARVWGGDWCGWDRG